VLTYAVSFAVSLLQALFLPVLSLYASQLGLGEAEVGAVVGASTFLYVPVALSSEAVLRRAGFRRPSSASLALIAAGFATLSLARDPLQLAAGAGLVSLGYGLLWPCVEKAVSAHGGSAPLFSVSWSTGTLLGSLLIYPLLGLGFPRLYALCALAALALAPLPLKFEEGAGEVGRPRVGPLGLWRSWVLCVGYSTSAGGLLTFYPLIAQRFGLPGYSVSLAVFSMMAARVLAFSALGLARPPPALGIPLLLAPVLAPLSPSLPLHALLAALAGAGQGLVYAAALEGVFEAGGAYTSIFEASIGVGYSLGPLLGSTASLAGVEPLAASAAAATLLSSAPLLSAAGPRRVSGGAASPSGRRPPGRPRA